MHKKRIFVGVDEAGYGPNLGPLVIAASIWSAPDSLTEPGFCRALEASFSAEAWAEGCGHVPLGDSKLLYSPSQGLASLEAGLLAMLASPYGPTNCVASLMSQVACLPTAEEIQKLPWYSTLENLVIPTARVDASEIERLSRLATDSLEDAGLELIEMQAIVVTETQFNSSVARLGSKGQLLSEATLGLVAAVLSKYELPATVFCDRQGGRKNYMPILLEAMPDQWFVETARSKERCSYRNHASPTREIHFSVGGDRFPPTALASMLAKYLRERLMEAFNRYWKEHIPDIKPTAGYPVDAKRFRAEMASVASGLGLSADDWWRCK